MSKLMLMSGKPSAVDQNVVAEGFSKACANIGKARIQGLAALFKGALCQKSGKPHAAQWPQAAKTRAHERQNKKLTSATGPTH
ncbi:hypothetical protein ACF8GB_01585 [Pseudomonas sp. xss_4]|uniref:hypothetical protein n=1 Tax=Pseudomonas TaxID=286 RepID=UPI0011A3E0DC|nr:MULTISPECIES: hypothetical protein [Pseudomonas]MBF8694466.1 hypothetical protein [Pseudomonas fulva]MEB8059238.1 hypothetical protein [Pseudomonas fulva]MEC4023391.1 hypothetical protein [Pseudomonas fulva]